MRASRVWRCLLFLGVAKLVCCDRLVADNDQARQNVLESTGKFRVPNPFDLSARGLRTKDQFYYFRSKQTTFEPNHPPRTLSVEEYFWLSLGLTYSLHSDIDRPDQEWAVIGDSTRAHFYVVRNPRAEQPDDCELDHAHNQRHVFPWQFAYESTTAQTDREEDKYGVRVGGNGEKKSNKKSVYGLGAIWLNAIFLDTRSDKVGEQSSYPNSNSWTFVARNGLKVELLFNKLDGRRADELKDDPAAYQKLLDQSQLKSVSFYRGELAGNQRATNASSRELEYITVSEHHHGLIENHHAELARFFAQLYRCRQATKSHRIFPSLLAALSTSASRHYQMDYIVQRLPPYWGRDGAPTEGQYDAKKHRYTFPVEFVSELFSQPHMAETKIYSPLPLDMPGPGGSRRDVYMALFGEKCTNSRPSSRSPGYYHVIENESEVVHLGPLCRVGEREDPPSEHLFVRHVNLGRRANWTADCRGQLTGLGALLMNAADFHYKSFSLAAKRIRVSPNPLDLSEFREAKVDEWRLEEKKLGWSVHFFFEQPASERVDSSVDLAARAREQLSRLVRIDVRDTRNTDASNQADEDANLLIQFTVTRFEFEADEHDVAILLTPPDVCKSVAERAHSRDTDSEVDSDEDLAAPFNELDDYRLDYSSDEDAGGTARPNRSEQTESEQEQAEEFEFHPGTMHDDFEMPSFFDYLDGRLAYEIDTKIVLEQDGRRKHIWLREVVDLAHEDVALHVYNSDEARERGLPADSHFIFYESELVFRVADGRCRRSQDIAENKWLRLFSSPYTYYTVANIEGQALEEELMKNKALAERSRLDLFGVGALWRRASESQSSSFLGKRQAEMEIGGRKYSELVWLFEERDMDIRLHFLQDLSLREEDERSGHRRPAHEYLSLHLIDFNKQHAGQKNGFTHIRAELTLASIKVAQSEPAKMLVPAVCADQYAEAQRMREQTTEDVKPPSFFDLDIGKASSYEMSYTVKHEVGGSRRHFSEQMGRVQTQIREAFDRERNLGKLSIVTGKANLTLFIDANSKRLYAHLESQQSGRKCSLVPSVSPLLGKALHWPLKGNPEFDPKKMFGLANLWIELAKLEGTLRVHYVDNENGHRLEAHTYKFRIEDNSAAKREPQTVEMTFAKRRDGASSLANSTSRVIGGIKTRSQERMELSMISIEPAIVPWDSRGSHEHKSRWYNSALRVTDYRPGAKLDWQLPAECRALDSGGIERVSDGKDGGGQPELVDIKANSFPQLLDPDGRSSLFHMKSEVSIQGALERVYLLEEWSHNKHLRMQSRSLGKTASKNFDFVIYEDTKEQFDLSRPFACKRNQFPEVPLGVYLGRGLESDLLRVWTEDEMLVNHLSSTYYSPLILWRMATKSSVQRKLVTEIEIAPLPTLARDHSGELLEVELERETWLVSEAAHSPPLWSYKMEFVRNSRVLPGGRTEKFHFLRSISLDDYAPNSDDLIDKVVPSRDFRVFIEILNYGHNLAEGEMSDKFQLPEGWGCQRDAGAGKRLLDELRLFEHENWLLNYEASLQLFVERTGDKTEVAGLGAEFNGEMLPTISGTFLRAGSNLVSVRPEMDIVTHHKQIRYADGRSLASRMVGDRSKSTVYLVDKTSGFCTMSDVGRASWRLEFAHNSSSLELHVIDLLESSVQESLFRELFMEASSIMSTTNNSPFSPLNRFSSEGGMQHASYERELGSLQLTSELLGPVRIVRKFSWPLAGERDEQTFRWHDKMATRVFLFDVTKSKLRAILDMTLERGQEPSLSELMANAQVRQCFNDGTSNRQENVRSFTLEYPIESNLIRYLSQFIQRLLRSQFYSMLLAATSLLPMQLDGSSRIGVAQHDNLLRIHFNVMDAPTSYVYLKRVLHCKMDAELEMKSQAKWTPTLLDCSLWCDQNNCAVMSYCSDHLCRIVTARAVFDQAVMSTSANKPLAPILNTEQIQRLSSCTKAGACSYYYQNRPWPRTTLVKFDKFMHETINFERDVEELRKFSIGLGASQTSPVSFSNNHEQEANLDHDAGDFMTNEKVVPDKESRRLEHKRAFGLLEHNKKLDSQGVDLGDGKPGVRITSVPAYNIGQCYDACEHSECFLLSHCLHTNECLLASGDQAVEVSSLRSRLLEATDCSVHLRDWLPSFQKFQGTRAPERADRRVEDVSALLCAAMCQATQQQCLSFDYCRHTKATAHDHVTERSSCLMQKSHVSLDSFDQSVFMSRWQKLELVNSSSATRDDAEYQCDHYSKNLLVDFEQLINRKLKKRQIGVLRGANEERCAALCIQDERCHAFEFCRDDFSQPAQSCRLIREATFSNITMASDGPSGQLDEMLAKSHSCSIYVARKLVFVDHFEKIVTLVTRNLAVRSPQNDSSWPFPSSLSFLLYALASLLLGAALPFVRNKLSQT